MNLTGPALSSSTIEYVRLTDATMGRSSSTMLPTPMPSARVECSGLLLSWTVNVSALSCIRVVQQGDAEGLGLFPLQEGEGLGPGREVRAQAGGGDVVVGSRVAVHRGHVD